VPVPCFLLFLCFRKATQEIFSELDETKTKPPIFHDTRRSPKMRRRGARGRPHPRVAWPIPGLRHQGVRPPGPPPNAALPAIYSPQRENPKGTTTFPETYREPPPSSTQDREGLEALPGTLPERAIATGGLMTHKYRGSQQSSREVKPKFIDSTQGEPKNIYKP
jgi:hypothetical protein